MNETLPQIIHDLQIRVSTLVNRNRTLNEEINTLKGSLTQLQSELEIQKKALNEVKEQNKIVKIAETLQSANGKNDELVNSINHYLREIEECIRLIGDSKL